MAVSSQTNVNNTIWTVPFPEQDWQQTPPSVRNHVVELQNQLNDLQKQYDQLRKQVDMLQGRVDKTSQPSSKPPSSDSPFQKPTRSKRRKSSGKRGARKGHAGFGPTLLEPTEVHNTSILLRVPVDRASLQPRRFTTPIR